MDSLADKSEDYIKRAHKDGKCSEQYIVDKKISTISNFIIEK